MSNSSIRKRVHVTGGACYAGSHACKALARGDLLATHLILLALAPAAGERRTLTIHGTRYATRDGTCDRDYVHVTDLAQAHVLARRMLGWNPRYRDLEAIIGAAWRWMRSGEGTARRKRI